MRRIAGLLTLAATVLLAGCFEIEGDLEDPYIKQADMAQPMREGFYKVCSISKRSIPECYVSELIARDGAFEFIERAPDLSPAEIAEWQAERDAYVGSQPGSYVFKRLEVSADRLGELGPVEAEVASMPLFLVGQRQFSEGEVTQIRYGLAQYNADEGYWEMWEPKCDDVGVGALGVWVRNDWLAVPDKKVSEWNDQTCVFKREGLDDDRLRFILSWPEKTSVLRLYWTGETDPDLRGEVEEGSQ